jgi:hypothetical protein
MADRCRQLVPPRLFRAYLPAAAQSRWREATVSLSEPPALAAAAVLVAAIAIYMYRQILYKSITL